MTFMDFGVDPLGSIVEPLCFEPITIGFALLMVLIGFLAMIILGVLGGTIGLATVIISNSRHELTVGKLIIIGIVLAIAMIVVPWVQDKWFSDHLHPPEK